MVIVRRGLEFTASVESSGSLGAADISIATVPGDLELKVSNVAKASGNTYSVTLSTDSQAAVGQ